MRTSSRHLSPLQTCLSIVLLLHMMPTQFQFLMCSGYCTGDLRARDIAGIWRLRSKKSFLPTFQKVKYPMKEFTVFPIKKDSDSSVSSFAAKSKSDKKKEILLLLREDGNFVQYGQPKGGGRNDKRGKRTNDDDDDDDDNNKINKSTAVMGGDVLLTGNWALVDGQLILAADRPKDATDIRSEGKRHDTILAGRVVATTGEELVDNPALAKQEQQKQQEMDSPAAAAAATDTTGSNDGKDVHLSVNGKISIGKFFYPQKHPSFFEQPMFGATPTGSFELQQILGTLNTNLDQDEKLVEKFRKKDLMNKKYFLTSYPIPTKRKKKQRWSIKYNKFVDDKPNSKAEKEREEREKNAPMQIKSFEIELFANNTFATITGLGGDTVLRGKWSIIGDDRDQLSISVWRFGFGRSVSGSTYSEGSHLTNKDDVSYWGEIYEVDTSNNLDSIEDDPKDWKGTKIEINGAVMMGVGLEPCSVARFTMIEKTEDDDYEEEDDDDDDEEEDDDYENDEEEEDDDDDDIDDLPFLGDDIGSFE